MAEQERKNNVSKRLPSHFHPAEGVRRCSRSGGRTGHSSADRTIEYDSDDSSIAGFIVRPPKRRSWDVRRRDPRVNGADLYVARVIKNGMGSARPCWRCLEWCRWAGIKRVFHWNGEEGKFECIKVNNAHCEPYETRSDMRLAAGLVSSIVKYAPECSPICLTAVTMKP